MRISDWSSDVCSSDLEELDVASALVAEVEVLPHDHDLGAEAPDEDLPDEVLSGLLRAGLVEGDHQAPVDARGGQQLELLVEVGEQTRSRLRAHDGGRMPVEGADRRAQTAAAAATPHVVDHAAVPAVPPGLRGGCAEAAGLVRRAGPRLP